MRFIFAFVFSILLFPTVSLAVDCTTAAAELKKGTQAASGSAEEAASYRRAIQLCPALVDAHFNLGVHLLKRANSAQALESFRTAVSLNDTPVYRLGLAHALVELKQAEEAQKLLEELATDAAFRAPALYAQAVLQRESGNSKRAEELLREAIQLDSTHALAFYNLGLVMFDQQQYEEAVLSFQSALEKQGGLIDSYLGLAKSFEALSRKEEAEKTLRKAILLDPNRVEVLLHLGALLEERGDLNEAFETVEKAANLKPNDIAIKINRAVLGYKLGQKEENAQVLRELALSHAQVASVQSAYGWVLLNEERFDEAKVFITRAIALDANDAFAHNNLGVLLDVQSDPGGAKEHFAKALELRPTLRTAAENIEKMK